jgi:hypothetical protein
MPPSASPRSPPLKPATYHCPEMLQYLPPFHRSPIHKLLDTFAPICNIEIIDPTPRDPGRQPLFSHTVAPSKEVAISNLANYGDLYCVYSDGSGYRDQVGAAAIATDKKGTAQVCQHHLGSLAKHTVFEEELVGTILVLDIICKESHIKKATILLDNQAAITALSTQKPQPGQYLIHFFHSELSKLWKAKLHIGIHIVWISGHSGVEGTR